MQRGVFAMLAVLLAAAVVYGATSITVNPSEMKNGETKSLIDGRNTITISRDGDDIGVKIEGAGVTRSLTVTRDGGDVTIERAGVRGGSFVARRVWLVCPKGDTALRVPRESADRLYRCPIDGAIMERRSGSASL